ncbi:MAG: alpha/beta fold hydrolase [Blastocatellia bacterium]|nr:alpha/beta fold hydrolase [Blastocatellia bacterium]
MKRSIFLLGLLVASALHFSSVSSMAQQQPVEGSWEGVLAVGTAKLRLVLHISRGPDGALAAKADSPDQGAVGMPVDAISRTDAAIHFEMKRLQVVYDGTLNREGTEIAGNFKQAGTALPLTLKRAARTVALNRPQEPKPPYPYVEEEVAYDNKAEGVKLGGALTLPAGKAPFPAVVLITGSGAQDRNEALLGHKPFLVLADYLTRQGIAVLRVDDRGIGKSTGSVPNSTSEQFATDVLAGVEFLKARKEIDPKRIGLIGHSEGGLIAPIVAARSTDIAFIVLMAGTGLTGEEILYLQGDLIARANGAGDPEAAKQRAMQELIFQTMRAEKDNAAAEKRMLAEFARRRAAAPDSEKDEYNEQVFQAQVKQVLTPWFRYFLTYDPRPTLKKVKCPVLALNGEKDLQVPPNENLREIEAALKAAGNRDVTIAKLPNLNHLFQTCKTGSPNEYVQIEETLSPVALKTIGDWIRKKTTSR